MWEGVDLLHRLLSQIVNIVDSQKVLQSQVCVGSWVWGSDVIVCRHGGRVQGSTVTGVWGNLGGLARSATVAGVWGVLGVGRCGSAACALLINYGRYFGAHHCCMEPAA